jgi:SAM-dependent methyltransferase
VDLDGGRAATRVDITAIQFGDAQFDLVLCSHVLEHVPDDARAMCEMWRVLRATGKLLLQVPLSDAMTDEDLTIDDPQERTRRYGQADHVRNYGWDIIDRLNACGWQVALFRAAAWLPQDIDLYRIDGEILVCTKGLSDAS